MLEAFEHMEYTSPRTNNVNPVNNVRMHQVFEQLVYKPRKTLFERDQTQEPNPFSSRALHI